MPGKSACRGVRDEGDARSHRRLRESLSNSADQSGGAIARLGTVRFRHGDQIIGAGCVLPLTQFKVADKSLGTRHRAAIGITEDSDAVAVVVSEETGLISFVEGGQIRRGLDATKLRASIFQALEAPAARSAREREKHAEKEAETEEIVST